jgi:RES domain-containing protein
MTEDDEILICIECVKDTRLKHLIKKKNVIGMCTCCGKRNTVINADSNSFTQMIKALIRYHYSEWEYNTHWGGNGHGALFYDDNNIFLNKLNFKNSDIYDELINRIECCEVYEDDDKGVSLFAGYYEGLQNTLLRSIKSDWEISIMDIGNRLSQENYFNLEREISKILSTYKVRCKLKIKKGEAFYRARVGFEDKKRSLFGGGLEGEVVYVPYSNSKIGAPPPHLAISGRLNRPGVSFLYCATDKYTAVSEIRPHPGDIVSIGKFILNKNSSIFDLTEMQFLNYYKSDDKLAKYKSLNTFTELMQQVIPPSERHVYNITQLVADCIRQLGFDGVLFPSSVGKGNNLVIFNPKIMDYTYQEAEVFEVKEVSYEYVTRKWKKNVKEIK